MSRFMIFVNGPLADLHAAGRLLKEDDFLLGVDGGARHLLALGLVPDRVIGDLDSLNEDELYDLSSADVEIDQYPEDKNETDLELALQYAQEQRGGPLVIVGGLGGRTDQALGNLALLADPLLANTDIRLDDGIEEAFFCRGRSEIRGRTGDTVSLIPWGADVSGVTTAGLKWALEGETLSFYKTRGISNEMTGDTASVQIRSGLLLVIHRHGEMK